MDVRSVDGWERPIPAGGNVALACGSGGWLSCISAVILGREHP